MAVPFACGYVLVWTGFSLATTALQFGLDRAGALSETMATNSAALAGVVLIVARWLSMDPIEASLPAALPLATGVPAAPVAPGRLGSGRERYAAWSILHSKAAAGC